MATFAGDLDGMSIKQLKFTIENCGLAHTDCVEKDDLIARARKALAKDADLRLELKGLGEGLMRAAKTNLRNYGAVMTTGYLLKDGALELCGFPDAPNTRAIANTMREWAKGCEGAGVTCEVWSAPAPEENEPSVRPSEHPDREESIDVLMQCRSGTWHLSAKFSRDAEGKPLDFFDESVGWTDKANIVPGQTFQFYN